MQFILLLLSLTLPLHMAKVSTHTSESYDSMIYILSWGDLMSRSRMFFKTCTNTSIAIFFRQQKCFLSRCAFILFPTFHSTTTKKWYDFGFIVDAMTLATRIWNVHRLSECVSHYSANSWWCIFLNSIQIVCFRLQILLPDGSFVDGFEHFRQISLEF